MRARKVGERVCICVCVYVCVCAHVRRDSIAITILVIFSEAGNFAGTEVIVPLNSSMDYINRESE